ncbi:MAG: hypothetical protein ACOVNU_14000 [Candidatus Kapaibacteriota bacterium]
MIIIDICLSDIPEWARKKANNGKVYAKFCLVERKEKDKFDNTHTVYMNPTKDQREAKEAKHYVGNGKQLVFGSAATPAPKQDDAPRHEDFEQLPF